MGELQKWGKDARRLTRYRCRACKKTSTCRTKTIRSGSHLKESGWRQLTKLVSLRTCPSGADIGRYFGKHIKTGQNYRRKIRFILPSSIAGPPLGISELDETTMRKKWIGGAKCRESRKIKLLPMEKRDETGCYELVDALLAKTSAAFTDEWRGYLHLDRPHYTVCHSREFVSSDCRAIHTNGIEGVWGHAKPLARHTYRGYPNLTDFLKEVCFLFNFNYHERTAYLTARIFRVKTNTACS